MIATDKGAQDGGTPTKVKAVVKRAGITGDAENAPRGHLEQFVANAFQCDVDDDQSVQNGVATIDKVTTSRGQHHSDRHRDYRYDSDHKECGAIGKNPPKLEGNQISNEQCEAEPPRFHGVATKPFSPV